MRRDGRRSAGASLKKATCTEPETCSRCGKTIRNALGHEWVDATCEAPKTCSRCGRTEGSALEHKWVEATCMEPETCVNCGKTKGKPLGHRVTRANYWNPGICIVCGAEVPPRRLPEILDGLPGTFMEVGKRYTYKSICQGHRSVESGEMITVKEYYSIPGAALVLEELEGYEWKIVVIEGVNKDPKAYQWNLLYSWHIDNCYDPFTEKNTVRIGRNSAGKDIIGFSVDWKGVTFDQCRITEDTLLEKTWDIKTKFLTQWYYVRVPVGFDGIIIGLTNGKNNPDQVKMPLKEEADDDSLFFRMD